MVPKLESHGASQRNSGILMKNSLPYAVYRIVSLMAAIANPVDQGDHQMEKFGNHWARTVVLDILAPG